MEIGGLCNLEENIKCPTSCLRRVGLCMYGAGSVSVVGYKVSVLNSNNVIPLKRM